MNRPGPQAPEKRIVVGIGNPFRSDDGAGPEVARRVRARAPEGVQVVEHDGEPAGLLDLWEDAQLAVVVDAVRLSTLAGGPFHRIEIGAGAGDLPSLPSVSTHGVGPGDAVDLARALARMPERLVLYGIEGSNFSPGVGYSPEVEAAISAVCDRILEEVSD